MQTIHCPACTFLNVAGAKTCEMCGSAMRPHQPAAQTAEPPHKKPEGPIVIDADEGSGGERDEGADGEGGSVSSEGSTAVAEAPEPHNPFASFSYSEDGAEGDARRPQPVQLGAVKRPPPLGSAQPGKKPKQSSSKNGSKKDCGPAEDFDAMPAFEQRVTFLKWHGVCAGARKRSPPADLQAYRFQLLAAVLISAQAQESMVRAAVETMAGMEGGLTAKALAAMEDTELAGKITSIHYNKAKAKHLVKAARLIHGEMQGHVPTTLRGLLSVPGIGPTLAPLLVFLFKFQAQHAHEFPIEEAGVDVGGEAEGRTAAPIEEEEEAGERNRSDVPDAAAS